MLKARIAAEEREKEVRLQKEEMDREELKREVS